METFVDENEIIPTLVKSRTTKRVAKSVTPLQDITKEVLNKNTLKDNQPGKDYSKVKKPSKTESDDEEIVSPIPFKTRVPRRKKLTSVPEQQPKKRKISLPLISSSDEETDSEEFKTTKKRTIKRTSNKPLKKVKFEETDSDYEESNSQVVFDISSDEDSVDIFKQSNHKKATREKESNCLNHDESDSCEEQDDEEANSDNLEFDEEIETSSSSSSSEKDSEDEYQPKKQPQKRVSKPTTKRTTKKTMKVSSQSSSEDEEMISEQVEKPKKATLTIKRKEPVELKQSENGWCFDVKNDRYVLKIEDDPTAFSLPSEVFEKLYSHQQIGVRWLAERHFSKTLCGGLLADEMGLGKTIQISSFIHGLFLSGKATRVLIIVPNSVIGNWQKELDKWAGDVIQGTVIFHQVGKSSSTNRKRQGFVKEFEKFAKKGGAVMLSTYQTIANHVEFLTKSFKDDKLLDSIIIDEAHKIKNKDAKCSIALKTLGSLSKFGLTGTPIMNKLTELYSIYSWCFGEDLLGSLSEFSSNYSTPINQSTRSDANVTQKIVGNRAADDLRELVRPYLMMRGKNAVLTIDKNLYKSSGSTSAKIGQKNDLVVWCKLSEEQLKWYRDYLSSDDVKQVLNKTLSPLVGIVILKQVCNHAIMCSGYAEMMKKKKKELEEEAREKFGEDSSDEDFIDDTEAAPSMTFEMDDLDDKQQKAMERRLKKIQEELIKQRIQKEPIETLISSSVKAQLVKQIVEKCNEEGHRVLIFSQYTRMLDIVGLVLKSMKLKFNRIDGSVTKHQERTRLVDEFNENKKIKCFILSTQAGGVGLNLVGASRVIIVDANFNPSLDEQSVDRCYRIGQKENVIVYRLISAGTIEEYIYKRQVSKTTVSRTATIASNQYRYLSHADLTEMFSLKKTSISETCTRLNKIHYKDRKDCDGLEEHIETIRGFDNVVGISDHDALFCNQADDVDSDEAEVEENNRLSRIELSKRLREAFKNLTSVPSTVSDIGTEKESVNNIEEEEKIQ